MDQTDRDNWRRADEILDALLDVPADQRDAHLEALQLSPELRARVESLLAALDSSDSLLDQPGPLPMPMPPMADVLDGRQLGRWLLEKEIGRGGMAIVYQAHSMEGPTGQTAAIKVLTIGALAAAGAERFLHEQRALLRMRHPYIATLYDAGIAQDGTAWLAMARVDGETIDAWCERKQLDIRSRIGLVLQVGEALAYAHRNLVIHRDIKPANVLVDDDGHVRLLDFGIARCADAIDSDSQRTATVLRALTPGYAAPEQFTGATPATAMDVFGLGALLYRLLTGAAPRSGSDGAEPITTPSRSHSVTAQERGAHKDWPRQLRGDLDAIMMKALAHEPEARYASIDAFDNDLGRWLAGKPVKAQPPSSWYRICKFVSRNRLPVAASLALMLVLVAGLGATLWQAQRAQQQATRAVAVKEFLVSILESSDPTLTQGRDPPASELLRRGAQRIDAELADRPQLHAELLLVIGRSQLARGLIADARTSLGTALDLFERGAVVDPQKHAATLSEQAMVLYEAGDLADAVRMLEHADALLAAQHEIDDTEPYPPQREQVRARLADLLVVALLETERGAAIANDLVQRMRDAGRTDDIDYSYALRSLGAAADLEGRPEEAITWLQQAAQGMRGHERADDLATVENELGISYLNAGKPDDAEQAFNRALVLQRKILGEAHPATLNTRVNLAVLHLRGGQATAAVDEFDKINRLLRSTVGEDAHPDVASNLGWQALANYRAGDTATALQMAESGWHMSQQLAKEDRANLSWLAPLLGLLRVDTGQGNADALLAQSTYQCTELHELSPLGRWSCLARSWRASKAGQCRVPDAKPPAAGATLDAVERRWWTVYWVLRADCGIDGDRVRAQQAIAVLAEGAQPPFPGWLTQALLDERLRPVN